MNQEFYTNVLRYGNSILYSGYKDGMRVRERVKYSPTLFIKSAKDTPYRSIDDTPVEPVNFSTMSEARDFMETYRDMPSFKIYGMTRWPFSFIQEKFPDELHVPTSLLNILYLDIEVSAGNGFPTPEEAREEITLIGCKSSRSNKYVVFGTRPYDPKNSMHSFRENIEYRYYSTEREMLPAFVEYFSLPINTPDILSGWNIRAYDVPYLINRIAKICGDETALRLSPWKKIDQRGVTVKGRQLLTYEIAGVSQLDYMDIFMKFANMGNQESYKLGHIAYVVLGESKVDYSDEFDSIHALYEGNFTKYVDYNVRDFDLVERMEKKLGLISLVTTVAYMTGVNYTDTLATTPVWDSYIFRYLAKKNIIIPPGEESLTDADYEGAFVKAPQIGKFDWVCTLDIASMYPNIIVQYNMSPETIIDEMLTGYNVESCLSGKELPKPSGDYAVAVNGSCYRRDKIGIIPELIVKVYDERVIAKKKMLELQKQGEINSSPEIDSQIAQFSNTQNALKVLLNSLYGACGCSYFRFYDIRIAEGITLTGQMIIHSVSSTINGYVSKVLGTSNVDYVLMNDTDSAAVNCGPVVAHFNPKNPHDFLVEFCSKGVIKELNKTFHDIAVQSNAFKERIAIKLEKVASAGVFTAKKKYMLNVISSEGVLYKEPKIKMTGISAIQSSTPECCRKVLKDTIKLILTGTEKQVQDSVEKFKGDFLKLPVEEIAFPRGVNNLEEYSSRDTIYRKIKGMPPTPINVRAALLYNHHVKDKGLEKKYSLIKSADKIKWCYLRLPNPIKENVIAFPEHLPKEFNLREYVDYEKQFETAFLSAINQITEVIGWKAVAIPTLEDFFS